MGKVRILLVDDHKVLREGLRMLIEAQPDLAVVGEADNGRVAVALAQQLQPDVVVMDISMPELNGLKATEKLTGLCPGIKILALTRHTDGYLQQLLEAGANGYVLKQSAADELVRAVRAVVAGKTYLDPSVAEQIVGRGVRTRAVRGSQAEKSLSRREEEVLRLVAWGYLNKEIASHLQISIKTAEAHKANAMTKLGMKGRIDVVRHALSKGWLQDT